MEERILLAVRKGDTKQSGTMMCSLFPVLFCTFLCFAVHFLHGLGQFLQACNDWCTGRYTNGAQDVKQMAGKVKVRASL